MGDVGDVDFVGILDIITVTSVAVIVAEMTVSSCGTA